MKDQIRAATYVNKAWISNGLCLVVLLNTLCLGSLKTREVRAAEPLAAAAREGGPQSVDPRLKIELFAEQPTIVTPTGMDVDLQGRVWTLESNTHFPPDAYPGHGSDRLLVLRDTNGDGRADDVRMFADGFTHAMSVAVQNDDDGSPRVFVASRAAIWQLFDDDNDGKSDRRETIVQLKTDGNYPHNGLAGFAFDALGWMYFGLGENLGAPYSLVGSDGTTLHGGGEGGNVYRCRPDGTQLSRWATGFWNPHANCVDAFGRLFSVDNDPDSRPPCRLLHVVQGGDYGYRFRNGRKGLHPFTSWNGELPGTLPMVAGTGEAPSGVVAYESDGLPAEYQGDLLVTSWGDHRIDRFHLQPRGASFSASVEPIVRGGEDFRPVGLAVAPDGSLFCTDWVKRDYKLHGFGRIWKISPVAARQEPVLELKQIRADLGISRLEGLLPSRRLDVRRAAARALAATEPGRDALTKFCASPASMDESPDSKRARREARWALDRQSLQEGGTSPPDASTEPADRSPLSIAALAADKRLNETDPFLFAYAVRDLTARLRDFDPIGTADDQQAYAKLPPRARVGWLLALRGALPRDVNWLPTFLQDPDPAVRQAAVQWVAEERRNALRPLVEGVLESPGCTPDLFLATIAALQMLEGVNPEAIDKTPPTEMLTSILEDKARPATVRALALRMLPDDSPGIKITLLRQLLASNEEPLRLEAVRAMQHTASSAQRDALLREVAADESCSPELRAEATLGLAVTGESEESANVALLTELLKSPAPDVRREALRSLRRRAKGDERVRVAIAELGQLPSSIDLVEELALAAAPRVAKKEASDLLLGGQPAAGRRVFFHANSAGCYKCHTVNGRGGSVGPDLSLVGRTMNRRKLAESILLPSKEVAPQFTNWMFLLNDGRQLSGMVLSEDVESLRIGTSEGKTLLVAQSDIEQRQPQKTSVMPEQLSEQMSLQELRDLLSFLETLK